MNRKRGRCALCTINKKEIKIMKQFKKLASLLLAAVLAMTLLAGCGGRGGNVGTAVTEQSILKYINEYRKKVNTGLSPVENDATLAQAAATLLEEFSKTPAKTDYGTGYKMAKTKAEDILHTATGKKIRESKTYILRAMGAISIWLPITTTSVLAIMISICSVVATKSSILRTATPTTATSARSLNFAPLRSLWQVM